MAIFNIISQLHSDLYLVIILGLVLYSILGGVIFYRFSSMIDPKYLLLLAGIDLTLFLGIMRFNSGEKEVAPLLLEDQPMKLKVEPSDLESTYKKPGKHKQVFMPDEASMPGSSYFNEDAAPTIENWEVDEYTHEEYVPDNLFGAPEDEY